MRDTATITLSVLVAALMLTLCPAAWADQPADLVLNGGAEQGKADKPSIWSAAQVPAEGLRMWRDTSQFHSGQASLAITNTHDYPDPVANNWVQQLQQVPTGKTLQLSAYIKTADADSANVCLQCWDKTSETMLAFASTPVVTGDQDWTQLRSSPVTVPDETASIMVRAAMGGKGKVWFDDISVVALADAGTSPAMTGTIPSSANKPTAASKPTAGPTGIDPDLAAIVKGKIVGTRPIVRDQMVLAYMPDWSFGRVDNIAIGNNNGGARTLIAWLPVAPQETAAPDRKFFLAVYAREVTVSDKPATIGVYSVLTSWTEQTSWKTQPKIADKPATTTEFSYEEGWKLFDVTPVVRSQAQSAVKENLGVMIRFDKEDLETDFADYGLVSREGTGEWKSRRPVLLIVEPAQTPQTQKATQAPPAAAHTLAGCTAQMTCDSL